MFSSGLYMPRPPTVVEDSKDSEPPKASSSGAQEMRELAWKCAKVVLAIIAIGLAVTSILLFPAVGVIVLGTGLAMQGAAIGASAACMTASLVILLILSHLTRREPSTQEPSTHKTTTEKLLQRKTDTLQLSIEQLKITKVPDPKGGYETSQRELIAEWYTKLNKCYKASDFQGIKELLQDKELPFALSVRNQDSRFMAQRKEVLKNIDNFEAVDCLGLSE